jgi:hypothetical protein
MIDGGRPAPVWRDPGYLVCAFIGLLLLGMAVTVNFPRASLGFQSDGATYYSMAHSLAQDGDLAFQRRDLERVWREYPTGPEGIFLKKGKTAGLGLTGTFPYLEWRKGPDTRDDRLYYGKSFTYPLFAAPFVKVFGTNGFLVFHVVLLVAALAAAYAFLAAQSETVPAIGYAVAFLFATAAPVYLVWLTPEMFNLCTVLLGLFFWAYKIVAPPIPRGRWGRFLRSDASDYVAAALLGIATFSKPLNILALGPIGLVGLWQRKWAQTATLVVATGVVTVALFGANVAISGEFNYQGGDRNTFYGSTGFPFQRPDLTFDTTGMSRTTNAVPTDVLFNADALTRVLPRNVGYFLFGRHTGLVAYFFPGALSIVLLLVSRRAWAALPWAATVSVALAGLALIVYMPYTYSGGGGPVGNRYFMGLYALFLFATPPLRSIWPAVVALAIGSMFTAQLVLNPFYSSFYPAEHPKRGLFRLLPVELSLINDLPMNVTPSRAKQPLAGDPAVLAYFLDDNAYNREGEWFWLRGGEEAQLILRAPAKLRADGGYDSLQIRRVTLELRAGEVANRVTATSDAQAVTFDLGQGSNGSVGLAMPAGLPYRPVPGQPTNFVYLLRIRTVNGFTPFFSSGSRDTRYLGAMVRIVPSYE